ncbi:replication factor C [Botrytis cinerea]
MASFFDIKARKAEAASNGTVNAKEEAKKNNRMQPWSTQRSRGCYGARSYHHCSATHTAILQSPAYALLRPPGTGKTSTVLALAKELYGPELMKSRVLELNASDERGISIVREKVKDFARMQLSNPSPAYRQKYPCPPYKIIILDEADSMTQDAQSALRRTMETYSRITRFCLICNYVTRIIDPLASRCSKFRFKSLDKGNAVVRVREIADKEGVRLEEGAVEALIKCSEGDLRKAITYLQSAARLVGAVSQEGEERDNADKMDVDEKMVTVSSVEDIAGVIPDNTIEKLVKAMQPRSRGVVYEAVSKVVVDMLYQTIINSELIADSHKNKIVALFSEADKRLVDGADEHLTILDLSLRISNILSSS